MNDTVTGGSLTSAMTVALSRRHFLVRSSLFAAMAALAASSLAEAQGTEEATPVDPDHLRRLLELSTTLCGGGTFDADRGTMLARFFAADPELSAGLDELLASPPVAGTPLGSPHAHATAQAILIYWYVGAFDGDPVPDRSTAYYRLTAWQAMYTPPWAVCKAFGAWADPPLSHPWTDPPPTDPLAATG